MRASVRLDWLGWTITLLWFNFFLIIWQAVNLDERVSRKQYIEMAVVVFSQQRVSEVFRHHDLMDFKIIRHKW